MTTSIITSNMNIDSNIPTGSWTMYFHSPEETKWTLDTFINLGSMTTWRDFWNIIEVLKQDSLANGMFFMMHDLVLPLWEKHQNIRGGCYSFRCEKKDASDVYINYLIASMLGSLAKNHDNTIHNKFNYIIYMLY